MKKILLFILSISYMLFCYSQNFTVKFSDEFRIVENRAKNKTIKNAVYHNGYIFSAVHNKSVGMGKWVFTKMFDLKQPLQLVKYDVNMDEVKEFKLEDGDKKFAPVEPFLLQLGTRLLVGYYKPYKKESFDFYLAFVDEESLNVTGEIKVFSVPVENVGIFKLEEELEKVLVKISVSPDQTRLMVAMMKDGYTVNIKVFDSGLKLEKQYETRLSGNESMILMSGLVTGANLIFCSFSSGYGDARILVIDIAGKKSEFRSRTFLPGKFAYNLLFEPAKNADSVYVYSTYSSLKGDNKYCNGFFIAAFNVSNKQLSKPVVTEFSGDFSRTLAEKGGGGGTAANVIDFVPVLTQLESGELVISGSPETSSQSASQSGSKTTVWSSSQVGSVFSFFLDTSFTSQGYSILPRRIVLSLPESRSGSVRMMQGARISTAYTGVYIVPKGESLIVVYSDYEKNINQGLDKPTYSANSPDNLVLAEAEVQKKGIISYRKQITEDQKGMYNFYLAEALFSTSDNTLLVPVGKQGLNFNANKDFYNKWCILEPAH